MSENYEHIGNFMNMIADHETHRKYSLNLLASENILSTNVRAALASDMAGRYSSSFYGGTKYIRQIIEETERLTKKLFNCKYAIIAPISGHMCNLAIMSTLTYQDEDIATIDTESGGYPFNLDYFHRVKSLIPFNKNNWTIDYKNLQAYLNKSKPNHVMLGASAMLFPVNISSFTNHFKEKQISYDGSHVLGLIAGKQFQDPLQEGAGVLFGSTHKSFFGPQGGIILTNNDYLYRMLANTFSIQTKKDPFDSNGTILVDNVHANRIAALGISMLEMIQFGEDYAKQVIINAQALGEDLEFLGFPIFRSEEHGITQNHQILMTNQPNNNMKQDLERANIFIDSFIRIGTAEITRMGMKKTDMQHIAELMKKAVIDKKPAKEVQNEVEDFRIQFNDMKFCF